MNTNKFLNTYNLLIFENNNNIQYAHQLIKNIKQKQKLNVLNNLFYDFFKNQDMMLKQMNLKDKHLTKKQITQYFLQPKGNTYITILTNLENNQIFGFSKWDISNKTANIHFLYIKDSYRKQGFGKNLLLQTINYITNNFKISQIQIGVLGNNKIARKLYENLGFNIQTHISLMKKIK